MLRHHTSPKALPVKNFPVFPLSVGKCDGRLRLKCDGTCAETRFRLSEKRTSPFKSARSSVQSTTGSRGVHINGSNVSSAGYSMFLGSVTSTGCPLHLPVYPTLPLPCVTVCHNISTGFYHNTGDSLARAHVC